MRQNGQRTRPPLQSQEQPQKQEAPQQSSEQLSGKSRATIGLMHAFEASDQHLRRLQQTTSLLSCPNCFLPRQTNTTQNFCLACGHRLLKLPTSQWPVQPVQNHLGPCQSCGSRVPLDLPNCLVCESPHRPKTGMQNRLASRELRVCSACHTLNPLGATTCLTCEAHLPTGYQSIIQLPPHVLQQQQQSHYGQHPSVGEALVNTLFTASVPSQSASAAGVVAPTWFQACPHCRHEIHPTARYCGWCGLEAPAKPQHQPVVVPTPHLLPVHHQNGFDEGATKSTGDLLQQPPQRQSSMAGLQCLACGLVHDSSAGFCSRCGSQLPRQIMSWLTENVPFDQATLDSCRLNSNRPSSTVDDQGALVNGNLSNAATQTVGIYYPSSASLRNHTRWPVSEARPTSSGGAGDCARQTRNRPRCLAGISPGKGFWRRQLEHLIAHLKIYTSNNPGFRGAIGEPRFGQLIMADMKQTATQAIIYLTYALPDSVQTDPVTERSANTPSGRRRLADGKGDGGENAAASTGRGDLEQAAFCYDDNEDEDDLTINGDENESLPDRRAQNREQGRRDQPRPVRHFLDDVDRLRLSSRSPDGLTGAKSPSCARRPTLYPPLSREHKDQTLHSSRSSLSSNTIASGGRHEPNRRRRRPGTGKTIAASRSHHGQAGVAMQRETKLSANDRQLFGLLGRPPDSTTGETEHDASEVRRFLTEGADPNCINGDGETPLIIAVRNRRVLAIPVLVSNGAKVNAKASTQIGNTALHEAVLSGENGAPLVQSLLKCGANAKVKNGRDQTAYSLALQMQCDALIRLFVTHWGEQELQKLTNEPASLPTSQSGDGGDL